MFSIELEMNCQQCFSVKMKKKNFISVQRCNSIWRDDTLKFKMSCYKKLDDSLFNEEFERSVSYGDLNYYTLFNALLKEI